jgi:hypothetical protein
MIEAIIKTFSFVLTLLSFQGSMLLLFRGRTEMPIATLIDEPERFELKTLPGAFVMVRQMTYGERMNRSNLSGAMKILKDTKSDYAGEMAMETERITLWDFANLVTDHNLETSDGANGVRKLDLKRSTDVRMLNARVGDEVGTYIDKKNTFTEADEGN